MAILREAPRAQPGRGAGTRGPRGASWRRVRRGTPTRARGCYCLVTSDDFLPGLLAMLHSLAKTKPACRHVVVLVTAQVSRAARAKLLAAWSASDALSVETKIVPAIPNPNAAVHVEGWVNAGYTKLHVFNLTAFRKVVYIDADTLHVRRTWTLFSIDQARRAHQRRLTCFTPDKFSAAGHPWSWNDRVASLRTCWQKSTLYPRTTVETLGLNSYFPDWFRSHKRTGCSADSMHSAMHWLTFTGNPGYWKSVRPIAILHFSSNPKPWTTTSESGRKVSSK